MSCNSSREQSSSLEDFQSPELASFLAVQPRHSYLSLRPIDSLRGHILHLAQEFFCNTLWVEIHLHVYAVHHGSATLRIMPNLSVKYKVWTGRRVDDKCHSGRRTHTLNPLQSLPQEFKTWQVAFPLVTFVCHHWNSARWVASSVPFTPTLISGHHACQQHVILYSFTTPIS